MMWLAKVIASFVINGVALWAADYFVDGFSISSDIVVFLKVTVVFTLIEVLVRPILKFVLSPFVFITFGVGIIVIDALVLLFLSRIMPQVAIAGLYPLVCATLIIGLVHFAFGLLSNRA